MHILLKSFSQQEDMPLVVIGNWRNSNYGLQLLQTYTQFTHIYLLDPIYEATELNFLRSHACLYIHGHSAGGTNPSIVEAMFFGLPDFAFDCRPNLHTSWQQLSANLHFPEDILAIANPDSSAH